MSGTVLSYQTFLGLCDCHCCKHVYVFYFIFLAITLPFLCLFFFPPNLSFTDIPAIPFNLSTTGVTSRNLTLSWVEPHPNNAPILGYNVFYTTPEFLGGNEVELTVNGSVEQVLIDRLHPGVTYNFTVLAFNEEGDSGRSEPFSQRTLEEGEIKNQYFLHCNCPCMKYVLQPF